MRLFKRLASLVYGLLIAVPAYAASVDERVEALLPWVGQQTGYSVEHVHPSVSFDTEENINKRFYGDQYRGQTDIEAYTVGTHITMRDDYQSPRDDYRLVHELDHVLQFEHGDLDLDGQVVAFSTKFKCLNQIEHQAYEVQSRYVDLTGFGWKPDPIRLKIISQCPSYFGSH